MADQQLRELSEAEIQNADFIYDQENGLLMYESFCDLFARDLTWAEFEYLLSRYPYIDLAQSSVYNNDLDTMHMQRHYVSSGWQMCDYEERIIAGPGRLAFGRYSTQAGEQDDEGGGSIAWQSVTTLQEIMMLVVARWDALHIIDGSHALQRLAWMIGTDCGLPVTGFEPTHEDRMRYDRILYLREGKVSELIGLSPHLGR